MILSDWGEIHGSLEDLEVKNTEEESKRASYDLGTPRLP